MNTPKTDDRDSVESTDLFDVGLSDAERERLALLAEECGEVMQVIGKILRHGYESHNPTLPKVHRVTNRTMLENELGDLKAAILIASHNGDIGPVEMDSAMMRKLGKVGRYLHFQRSIPFSSIIPQPPREGSPEQPRHDTLPS